MYAIQFTSGAHDDLQAFPVGEQKRIVAMLETHLMHNPAVESPQRKRLEGGGLHGWQFRSGGIRVFYAVDAENQVVRIEAIGKSFQL